MKIVKLMNECDDMRLMVCKATKDDSFFYTGVRADGCPPEGSYGENYTPLFTIDVDYDVAWRWMTKPSIGEATNEQRFRLFLGEKVVVNGWTIERL